MPPKHTSSGDIFITVDGKEIGSFQSISTDIITSQQKEDIELKDMDSLNFHNRSYSGTFKDVTFNREFLGNFLPTNATYTVVGTRYKFPRGKKLPKKKRLRKKWMKKYEREIKLENVYLDYTN